MEHVVITIVCLALVGAFVYYFIYKPRQARKNAGLRKPVDDSRRPR